jgi:hypothetical protein
MTPGAARCRFSSLDAVAGMHDNPGMTRKLAVGLAAFGLALSAPAAAQAAAGHPVAHHAATPHGRAAGLCFRHGPIQIGLCR